jgi:hypothetical protein
VGGTISLVKAEAYPSDSLQHIVRRAPQIADNGARATRFLARVAPRDVGFKPLGRSEAHLANSTDLRNKLPEEVPLQISSIFIRILLSLT